MGFHEPAAMIGGASASRPETPLRYYCEDCGARARGSHDHGPTEEIACGACHGLMMDLARDEVWETLDSDDRRRLHARDLLLIGILTPIVVPVGFVIWMKAEPVLGFSKKLFLLSCGLAMIPAIPIFLIARRFPVRLRKPRLSDEERNALRALAYGPASLTANAGGGEEEGAAE